MKELLERLPPLAKHDFSEFGEVESKPLSRIQSISSGFLHRNWISIPHVSHSDEVDVTLLETRRKKWNLENPDGRYTILTPLVKAVVGSLKDLPKFNSSLDDSGKNIVFKKYFNVGIAVDTANGLLVPVIRDCDKKSNEEIRDRISGLAEKARDKGLSVPEMSGGCFTISSLGHIGGTGFTPIINAPEVAILGVSAIRESPFKAENGDIDWRLMLPLTLSYDHRVVNGVDAANFLVTLGERLSTFEF